MVRLMPKPVFLPHRFLRFPMETLRLYTRVRMHCASLHSTCCNDTQSCSLQVPDASQVMRETSIDQHPKTRDHYNPGHLNPSAIMNTLCLLLKKNINGITCYAHPVATADHHQ